MSLNLSTLLDVTLSLVFVFFTLSLFVSGVVEFINALREQRSALLQLALLKILERPDVVNEYKTIIRAVRKGIKTKADGFEVFWNHPLVRIKRQRYFGLKPISYLSADSFSTVILDLLTRDLPAHDGSEVAVQQTIDRIRSVVANPDAVPALAALKEIVRPLLAKSESLADFKKSLETWYDGYMEQVSGWFKRYAQAVVWMVAGIVSVGFNIDTIRVTNELFANKTLRDNLVAQAEQTALQQTRDGLFRVDSTGNSRVRLIPKDSLFVAFADQTDSVLTDSLRSGARLTRLDSLRVQALYLSYLRTKIDALNLPIGWRPASTSPKLTPTQRAWRALGTLLGWLLTATALSFGAPFWFDLLLKIVNIRNVTRKPVSSVVPDAK